MPAKPSDKYIPLYFVGFFVIIFIVNAIFLYFATKTHTGVITENAYEKGLDYNKTIELAETQEDLGGKIELAGNSLIFTTQKKVPANVTAYISRPTQAGFDFDVVFERNKTGQYIAKPNFPMQGQWKVTIVAKWDNKQYQQSKIVIVE